LATFVFFRTDPSVVICMPDIDNQVLIAMHNAFPTFDPLLLLGFDFITS